MTSITDRINDDVRLEGVSVDDQEAQAFLTSETVPVLATPAVAGAVTLVAAGAAYGQAID
ncbi:hypothetical protein [Conexibacter sp. SYSU D00693]|uniref:hypothetical protein n=1 Tax=Conexibacter sp. SYSU D00693 TaxID=2812560 RepID=UPI00196BA7B6|nr:hypothetical protein [Conexibacter sp. SYSU D00693]